MFGQVWAKESSELTEKLSKHTLGGPLVLTGTDWQVALQVRLFFLSLFFVFGDTTIKKTGRTTTKRFMHDQSYFSLLADEVG